MPQRAIVWGAGTVGVPALRIVLSNPALALAGVMGAFRLEIEGIVGGRALLVVDHVTRIVTSIPFVCAAPPGMLDALEVPLATGRGLVR